jgi:hypothetical protein
MSGPVSVMQHAGSTDIFQDVEEMKVRAKQIAYTRRL